MPKIMNVLHQMALETWKGSSVITWLGVLGFSVQDQAGEVCKILFFLPKYLFEARQVVWRLDSTLLVCVVQLMHVNI